ncbi:MAG: ankyrin repeat protein/serine/threonine protein kinase [Chlamydiales bacterium]|jgi:ankyrin repeat protein/serine/threonine protein kinase
MFYLVNSVFIIYNITIIFLEVSMTVPINNENYKNVIKVEPEGRLRERFKESTRDLTTLLSAFSGDSRWVSSNFNLALKAIRVIPRSEVNSESTARFFNVLSEAGLLSWKKDGVRALLGNEIRFDHNLMIKQLLEKTIDKEYLPKLLFEECYKGHVKVVDKILEMGLVEVNEEGEDGRSVLHNAAEFGDISLIQNLLLHGADINKKNHARMTPVDLAIKLGRIKVAEAIVGMPIIEWAILDGRHSELGMLVDLGADINAKNDQGYTAAHLATEEGNLELLKRIAVLGADFEKRDKDGLGVAHLAVINNHEHILSYLKIISAKMNLQDNEGKAPIHYAAELGHYRSLEAFFNSIQHLEIRDTHGYRPIHYAAIEGRVDVVRLLLERGSEINPQERNQATPLHLASMDSSAETCSFLINAGADISSKDINGSSPIHYACNQGCAGTVVGLIEAGADIYSADISGNYPFDLLNILPEDQTEWIELLRGLSQTAQNNVLQNWEEIDWGEMSEEDFQTLLIRPIQGIVALEKPEYKNHILQNLHKFPKEALFWALRSIEHKNEFSEFKVFFDQMPPMGKLGVVAAMPMEHVEPFLKEVQEHLFYKIGENAQYQNIPASVERLSSMLSHGISTPQYQEVAVKQYNSLKEQYHNFVEYLKPWSELARNERLDPRVKEVVERAVQDMDNLRGEISRFPSRLSVNALSIYGIEDFGIGKVIQFIDQYGPNIFLNSYVRRKDWNLSGVDLPKSLTKTEEGQWVVHLKSKNTRFGGKLWGSGGYKKVKASMVFNSSMTDFSPLAAGTIKLNTNVWSRSQIASARKNTEREVNFGRELKDEQGIVGIHSMTEYSAGGQWKIGVISDLYDKGDLLDSAFRLSQKEKGRVLSDSMRGLIVLEQKGIRHRDIKPENIFIKTGENQKLSGAIGDFGLSVRLNGSLEEMHYRTKLSGTPRYLAPEVARDPRNLDKQDIFAMGWTMYIAHYPSERIFWDLFDDKSPLETLGTIALIHSNPLVNSTSENFHNSLIRPFSNSPDPLRRLIAKCLHPDPRNRPNAENLLAEYQHCLNQKGIDIS